MRLHPLLPITLVVLLLLLVFVPVPSRNLVPLADSGEADADLPPPEEDDLGGERGWTTCEVPLDQVDGLNLLVDHFGLDEGQLALLREQCLVGVRPSEWQHSVWLAYSELHWQGLPTLVTSDSVLHAYHVLFDSILEETESRFFTEDLQVVTNAMLNGSLQQESEAVAGARPLALRNAAFFGVALRLLNPEAPLPAAIRSLVEAELRQIEEHAGFAQSPLFNADPAPQKPYLEDYSQYVPRGHYDRTEALARYFLAMIWYGRLGFRLAEDAETQSAILMANQWGRLESSTRHRWWRMYNLTSFFVGEADDLLPPDYLEAVRAVYGGLSPSLEEVLDPELLAAFRERVDGMQNPRIVSTLVVVGDDPVEETKGLRFMGQRYLVDSHVLQLVVYPKVERYLGNGEPFTLVPGLEIRGFPRGLDVMAALGSDLAADIVEEEGDAAYVRFPQRQQESRSLFEALADEDWNDTLYLSWLRSLRAGLQNFDHGAFPRFMRTEAFAAEKIHTALASWAQLRHDTILYAKQGYTGVTSAPPAPPEVYVEPVVELFHRLQGLVTMTLQGLERYGVLNETAGVRLTNMEALLDRLIEISEKELAGTPLRSEDRAYLTYIDGHFRSILRDIPLTTRDTRIVADVHTEPNTQRVLEEATGELGVLVVAVQRPDGTWFAVAGPILTYYEFKHPMSDRLTDGAWREMLATNPPPDPTWLSRFVR